MTTIRTIFIFLFKVAVAGFMAMMITHILDSKLPGSIELAITGFAVYSFVSVLETMICKSQALNQPSPNLLLVPSRSRPKDKDRCSGE